MIKWDQSYALGIPLIDAQHQKLFEIANALDELLNLNPSIGEASFDKIMDAQDKLVDYTKYHFSQEEKLMTHYGYDGMSEHFEEHKKFIRYLDEIDYLKVDKNPREGALEMLKFVTQWIFKHILKSDFAFKDHIISEMSEEQRKNRM